MRARSATTADAELLASAVALRWSRPDLTAAVAEHVAVTWAADDRTWVAAAGWLVHGRAAVGDGRECASDTLAELVGRDPALLDEPAADRLRIEVAALAAAQCEPAVARLLVEPLGADRPAEVRADALAVLARCAFEDRPAAVGAATRRAAEAWAAVRGADAEIAVAALTLLSGSAARRAGRPDAAVEHAAEGLARLDDLRPGASAPHLAAALAAEWITALVEAGRTDDARAGCDAVAGHLAPTAQPTRQRALLRLTVARALAASASPGAFEALEQAAADACACDAPDLEGLCLSTLGTLREQAGRLDAALESMRRGLAAQRRDRARSERFRAALRELPLLSSGVAAPVSSTGRRGAVVPSQATRGPSHGAVDRPGEPHPLAANPWITGSWTAGSWTTDATSDDMPSRRAEVAAGPGRATAVEPGRATAVGPGRGAAAGPGRATAAEPGRDTAAGPGRATSAEPGRATGVGPGRGTAVEPGRATAAEPGRATAAEPGRGTAAEPGRATAAEPGRATAAQPGRATAAEPGRGTAAQPGRATAAEFPDVDGANADLPATGSERDIGGDAAHIADDPASDPLFGPFDGTEDPGVVGGPTGTPEPEGAATAAVAGRSVSDSESWLAKALAELGRVWDSPLPEPGSVIVRPDEPSTAGATAVAADTSDSAPASDPDVLDGPAEDEHLMSPWAAWTDNRAVVDAGDAAALHTADDVVSTSGVDDRPSVVGCVVVVDVVCAGAPVPEGVALLGGLLPRLADRIPSGARMRIDEGEATLSVVLPGQDRIVAASWMHRTLPAVFHDAAASDDHEMLPIGSALRAAVHDTDGPVGAQLLQRLDRVRAGRDQAPPVPVRWGVPIAPGSGGRRRADDVEGAAPVGPDGPQRGRHRQGPDGLLAAAPGEATDVPGASAGGNQRTDDARGCARGRSAGDAAAGGLAVASAASDDELPPSSDDTELSVEGLGLADLLAGALAAYRAI